ncbi:protein ZINC INDUCED FACILITATOR-LIKE 1 isoform X1 [Daucus carota subsp. sativus]|uniref:protein ZINC INDUCED FACILITATOR-LIKE 1 isoform X1 n=1 Tax=Daucus carota subsp. sativus TaxID=79200 RepID=UPI0007EEF80E|nr:PREDICTED: protein ZINC INDUCED FACILITATOR-LIKE 1-like isoform X1 [Daucus carota subsp. sativus]XP_017226419.1 PREDICTED: protein ZINC INDUCED FACILITATOR-LIKE 1-like isoform X1 [Daucus carota subsp. sativus]
MAGDNVRDPLLNVEYYENCPGCQVDQQKAALQGHLPIWRLLTVFVTVLATAMQISSLFPFVYFMVQDFNIADQDEDISYYAGFVGSSFMLGRALTSVFWGKVADLYGRRPVIIIGTSTIVIFNTLFGLSINYWMAVTMRFLLGSLNGLLGPIRAYTFEILQKEHHALGLSVVAASWGTGLILGPALGGFLAKPADNFPDLFSPQSIFARFPYFLPCLSLSLFALVVLIASLWLPETLHNHDSRKIPSDDPIGRLEISAPAESDATVCTHEETKLNSKESIYSNWPLMSSILVYCVFAIHEMAYLETFPLWAESPRRLGGLSYSTVDVGEVLAISGVGLLLFEICLYPKLEKRVGCILITRISAVVSIPLLTSYTYIAMLSGILLSISINCASLLKNILNEFTVTGLFILQNRAVDQHQRGTANGISMSFMSLSKAIGPAIGGALLSWAQGRQDAAFLPGPQMLWFILNIVQAIGVAMTFKPFLVERRV